MAERYCKIKQLLKDNQIGLNAEFVSFMTQDQNLAQLSKLIELLNIQRSSSSVKIAEPMIQHNQDLEHRQKHDLTPSIDVVEKNQSVEITHHVEQELKENECDDLLHADAVHEPSMDHAQIQPILNIVGASDSASNLYAIDTADDFSTDLEHQKIESVQTDIAFSASQSIDRKKTDLKGDETDVNHLENLESINQRIENNDLQDTPSDQMEAEKNQKSEIEEQAIEEQQTEELELPPQKNVLTPSNARAVQDAAIAKSAESTQAPNPMFSPDVKFQVDNARAGQLYRSKITVTSNHDSTFIQYKPESFKFSRESFYFDDATQTIQGQPEIPEELTFSFQYYLHNETRTAQCKINVIADPRSLWKVLEPEAGQPYAKPHTDQALLVLEDYKLIAASRRGRSHEHGGTFRDDDFGLLQIEDSPWSVLVAADGAGSAGYSREGSRIAVEIVKSEFARYLTGTTIASLNADVEQWQIGSQEPETQAIANKLNQQFYHVYYEIYKSIIHQIELQASELGVAAKLFSTTLLVAVVYSQPNKNFISTFSVGDGAIAVYNDSSVRIMNVADGGEYAGQTKFLDRSIAQEFGTRVKIGCFEAIDAVMVMTDGISDPLFETDVGLTQHERWKKLYTELDPLMKTDVADTALLEWMHFFTPGHHDDRTMAVLWKR
ncbi:PP2C family serine/threonine-protein phosphatase [Acinetobacter lanii]|uniref:PP2C family serine/threonine-protein phosphatase n=1 Tax=Acinetobacter lanii TaxID=2715163 RepID=UPI001D0F25BE|nr:PP2C family serine/threonine-protein phosphatase [Acinetobacter lanii]